MPFKTFNNWLFDRNPLSPIPPARDNVDILKYNSSITNTFVLSLFMRNRNLNHYLNEYFNNMGLRYLQKDELFTFIKKCVFDFRINKRDTVFYKFTRKDKIYNILRDKFPQFKNNDITLLCDLIERSEDKGAIYQSLGLDIPKKQKLKIGKQGIKKNKISLKEFMAQHFSVI